MTTQPKPKNIKDLIFFVFLFLVCIIGSVGIFLFAVGIETGHPIIIAAMRSLLDNFYLVFFSLLFFNGVIFYLYKQGQPKK